ncbi:hypothetical protein JD276_04980 [Leucobacter sp. CSA1]|uniref:NrtR DNA-binding winged helix domain-containing protein n=1 Tax=Leucobacter chromiisoli TaxID=2796471 RepID=A0A934UUG0_9MICO|nr:hypothetical protein [Leucobacter chromiisoli]MBK0418386.1 hypothetical protein [Leucobacter chromiisoli]
MHFAESSASERRYLPPAVAVSTVAFALHPPEGAAAGAPDAGAPAEGRETTAAGSVTLWIPLVRRTRPPFEGRWALPGGPTQWDETLVDTASRTLHDAVLRPPGYLEQLYAFGSVERSAEAQRLVTIGYWALYGERDLAAPPSAPAGQGAGAPVGRTPVAAPSRGGGAPGPRWDDVPPQSGPRQEGSGGPPGENDPNVAWFSADRLPRLAFDHVDIVEYALWRLRRKTEYSAVAHRFLGPVFTLAQLRSVHEAILGNRVDPANFRRQALAQGHLVDTGAVETGTRHRPARLFRFRAEPEDAPRPDR